MRNTGFIKGSKILLILLFAGFLGCSHSVPGPEQWPQRPYEYLYKADQEAGYFIAGVSRQVGKTSIINALREDYRRFKPTTVFIEEPRNINVESYIEKSLNKRDEKRTERDWLVKWATDDDLKIEPMSASYLESARLQLDTRKVKDPIRHFIAIHTYLTLYAKRKDLKAGQYDAELKKIVRFAFGDTNLSFISKIGKLEEVKNYISGKYPSLNYYDGLHRLLDDYSKDKGYPFFTQWLQETGGFKRQHKFVAPYPFGKEPSNILSRIYYDATDNRIIRLLSQYSKKRVFATLSKSHFRTVSQRLGKR
jgi:hypothetical protein